MTRRVKKKKKLKLTAPFVFFGISLASYLVLTPFLVTMNNKLAIELQTLEAKAEELTVQNDDLKVQIQKLTARDRVTSVAEDYGLKYDNNSISIVTVSD